MKMRILPALLTLAVLGGCQTTKPFDEASWKPQRVFSDRDEYRGYLADVARKVCVANLGSEERMAEAASSVGQMIGKREDAFLGAVQYTSTAYVLNGAYQEKGRNFEALLVHAGGATCGISTSRKMRMPQYMRQHLDIEMEHQVWDIFEYSMVDVTYGYRGHPRYPVRQYSTRPDEGEVLDYLEFMTPSAYRQDRMFSDELESFFAEDRAKFETDDAVFYAIRDVCIANIDDLTGMQEAARSIVQTPGVALEPDNGALFFHMLNEKEGAFSSIIYDFEGQTCGYVELGAPVLTRNGFELFDAVPIETSLKFGAAAKIGYSVKYDIVVVEVFEANENQEASHYIVFLSKDTLERGRDDLMPKLPWNT